MNISIIRIETYLQNSEMALIPSGTIQAVELVYEAKSYDEDDLTANVWSGLEDELFESGLYYPVNSNWVHHQHLNDKYDRLTIGYVADNNITVANESLINHIHSSIDGDERPDWM
ncbi:hypothetical protein KII93_05575 [Leuconostoc gelidum subsp. gasicomitatum]|uniref:hypothetical protein n=1 Tax=Leuconostoc gasicomitatum TaxID=115778 RepID=UPI001CC3954B|nr:hypothetical protein [Leuconostoc gasicomitatum]MBZ5947937.1 hypothetical protein [Leuconostoc gasicomitatum]